MADSPDLLSHWVKIANSALNTLTRDEVASMVEKGLARPGITPALALKLDIIGRQKVATADKAERAEAFNRLGKTQRRQALAEFGPDYFIEGRRIEAEKPPEPYGPNDARRYLGFGPSS